MPNHEILSKKYHINPFPKKPQFLRVSNTSHLKTLWEKEKLIVTTNFCFSHSIFYLYREFSAVFNKFENVASEHEDLPVWKSLKFVVLERVDSFLTDVDTRSFCRQCRLRPDYRMCSLMSDLHCPDLCSRLYLNHFSSCNGSIFLANEKL